MLVYLLNRIVRKLYPAGNTVLALLLLFCLVGQRETYSQQKLDSVFAGFEPFLNKIFKGYFLENGEPTKSYDIFHWEKILNGNAIRGIHSVNDGIYGGETIFRYDAEAGVIRYYYFTTAQFMTSGTVTFEGDLMLTDEAVEGNEDGITRVRGETRILADGRVHVKSRMLKKGEWAVGHEIYYTETPEAEVKFKK